jgi:hypothetical protein
VRRLAPLVALLASCRGEVPPVIASNWPEADAIFHSDPRWLGADGAYSVDLGGERTLWLFGDTSVAREPGGTRGDALFLRNTAAVQTGREPSRALMAFYWGADDSGSPHSFIAQDGSDWFWPGGGAPQVAVFAEHLFAHDAFVPDGSFFRAMAGVVLPGRVGEVEPFVSLDGGNGKGLLVQERELRLAVGVRYALF